METEGKDTAVKITLPFLKIEEGYITNPIEENEKRIPAKKHVIEVPVRPFGIATLRIQGHLQVR